MKGESRIYRINQKIMAVLTVITVVMQICSPFVSIVHAAIEAGNTAPDYKYVVIKVDKSEDAYYDYEDFGIAHIQLVLRGNLNFSGFDICFKYDDSIIKPTYNAGTNRKPNYVEATAMEDWDITTNNFGSDISDNNTWLFASDSKFRIEGTAAIDKNPQELGNDVVIADMYFLLQDGYDIDSIPSSSFILEPADGIPTGMTVVYDTYYWFDNSKYLGIDGLVAGAKEVDSISVKTEPNKTTYEHGETVDLTGGIINVKYTDGTDEDVDMTNSKVSIATGSPANVNITSVTLSYEGKQTSFDITINDPVESLVVKSPMSDLEYSHGESFNFSGLQLEATTKSGKKIPLTTSSQGVSTSELLASINSSAFTKISAEGVVPVSGTQVITFTYEGKSATQTAVVNDKISSIKVKNQPTKKVYKRGESLDLTGAVIEVSLESGSKTDINLPNGSVSVSNFNSTTTGVKQKLTVSMGTQTAVETIDVEVYNYITSIDLIQPTDRKPKYNTDIDLTGSSITEYWADNGIIMNIPVTASMISNYNKTILGTQTVTVTYNVTYELSDGTKIPDQFTKTFNVTVMNSAKSISITAPSKNEYKHGESLNLTDGKIVVTYEDNSTSNVTMTESMITESDGSAVNMSPATYDSTNKVSKTLKITYTEDGVTGNVNYPITIINDVKSIAMHQTPKVNYNVNDTIELSNGEILVTRAVGNPEVISLNDSRVKITGFNSEAEHVNLPIKVEFTENGITKETSYNIDVTDSVKSISVQNAPTTVKYGEELDLTNMKINVVKGSGTTQVPVTTSMLTNFNKNQLGQQQVTVTYGGQTDTFNVTVQDYVTGITVSPATVTGNYNKTLDDIISENSIKYTVTYAAAGAQTPVDLTASMVTGYSATTTAAQNLTVTYTDNDTNSFTKGKDFTANLTVTLSNVVTGITITAPTKTTYNHGESLSLTGGVINLTYADGTKGTEPITSATIEESDGSTVNMSPATYDSTNKVSKTLKITYTKDGVTGNVNYPIEIINDIKSISVHTTPKTQYNVNDSIDLTNGEIKVVRAVGTDSIISMSDANVSVTGFNSSAESTSLPLTVSYTENGITKTTSYNVVVTDSVTSISVQGAPTTVKYGEELDLSGTTIDIVKGSGTTSTAVTSAMISNFNKNQLGQQQVTVTYGGQTDTFNVTVQDYVTGITVTPGTVTGNYNKTLNDIISENSIKYTVTYAAAGAQIPVDLVASMVAGYSATSTTAQNLTVTYTDNDANSFTNGKDFTANLTVTLSNVVSGITITAPTKTTYNHGESLSLTGGVINLTYADGTKGTEPITSATIEESDGSAVNMSPATYDSTNKVSKTLKITYTKDGVTGNVNYPIEIINDIKSISVHTTPKTQYNVNDSIDLTNGEIKVVRAVGTDSIISMSDANVSVTGFNSSAENTNLPLTVSYTENGITKTTSYNVIVADSVTSISVQGAPTTVKYGEELDLSGTTIDIVKGSGTTSTAVTSAMISNFNKNQLGQQQVTVTYGGQTDTFNVTVQDYVTGITVSPATVTGSYNATLSDIIDDNNIKYTVTYASAGAQTPVDLVASMVAGYSATSTTAQNLTVTYTDNDANSFTNGKDFTANLTVTLSNVVSGITITAPTKTTYNHGESLSLTGGVINLTYADGTKGTEPITSATIEESDGSAVNMSPATYDSTNKVSKTLKITYTKDGVTGNVNYPIEIINDIKSISVHTTPKTQYNVNDSIDLTNGEIKVVRAVGQDSVISMSDANVSVTGFNSSAENTNLPLTVSYTENGITKTTTYNVVVTDSVTSISVQGAPTTVKYGEELDLSGTTIDIVKGSGNSSVAVTSAMISNFNKNQLGQQQVTVTYGGQTDTFNVTVQDYVTGITVNPATVTGSYNATLSDIIDDNNIKYTVTYASAGAQTPVDLVASMVAGYSATSITAQNLTVTYTDNDTNSFTNGKDFTANLNVTLSDAVASITVTAPSKTTYNHGESLDLTGGTITVTSASGASKTVTMTNSMITEGGATVNMSPDATAFGTSTTLNKTLTITYTEGGKTGTVNYPITIVNNVKSITMHQTPKTQYNVNDSIDLTNGEILVTRATGTPEVISLSDSRVSVSGFDSTQEHVNLAIKVEFTENGVTKETSYNVKVTDSVESIKMGTTPKTNYKYGEELDITTGTIEVKKGSTTTTIPITSDMVSGYNKNILGEQTITITYGGQTTEYKVTVSDYVKDIVVVPPTKVKYECGENLDLNGGSVQKVMASGAPTTSVPLSDASVQLSTFNPNQEGTQKINVTYEGFTESFDVVVEDNVQSISINPEPKTQYKYGEALSVAGGKIVVTKSSGKTETIDITTSMVTGYNPNQLGSQELTVTYKGKTAKYNVNVEDYIKDISLVKPDKLVYKVGESIDLTGGKVSVVMASGASTSSVDMADVSVTITGFSSTSVGAKLITVTYQGLTKTFGVTVVDELSSMVIKTLPDKLDYRYDESLDLTGGTIEIERESGAKEIINMTPDMVSGYNAKQLGPQTLTVTYQGFKDEFIVNVEDYISKLEVQAPSKVEYEYGEELDLAKGNVSIVMASGKIEETVDMTASMVSGFNAKQEGKQTIKVEYKGLQGSFQVNVVDKIKGISINSEPDKKEYKYEEDLDLTGATITVVKSSGTTIIPITKDMVSGYNPTEVGTQTVTVTYGGFTAKFVVKVNEPEKTQTSENVTPGKQTNVQTQTIIKTITRTEQLAPEETVEPEETPVQETPTQNPQEPEKKPTETLGVKEEKEDDSSNIKAIAGMIGGFGMLLLFLLVFFKRNTKVYVEEDGEFVLGGMDKIKRSNPKLDIDQYLDGETYHNKVKIVLNKSISKSLDGEVLKIKHRGEIVKYKINYQDEPYEIILQ